MITRKLAPLLVVGSCVLVSASLLGAPNELVSTVEEGAVRLELPASASEGTYRQLEWSDNLVDWEPVARDYGFAWEGTYPHALQVWSEGETEVLEDTTAEGARYYRVVEMPGYQLENMAAAARFLQQSTFGPTRELLTYFPGVHLQNGFNEAPYPFFEEWIDEQVAKPVFSLRRFWRERSDPNFLNGGRVNEVGYKAAYGTQLAYNRGQDRFYPDKQDAIDAGRPSNDVSFGINETKQIVWYQGAVTGEDALRQRLAWALNQIFVVGESGSNQLRAVERYISFYDIFINNAFGNFRDILGEVTWHPNMGYYLTYVDNRVENPIAGIFPDENYAREVMQLFTIGLWELNQDGTHKLDVNGESIPTYSNEDITEFAKVFTGMRKAYRRSNIEIIGGNYVDPMRIQVSWHDYTQKTLLDGTTMGPFPQTQQGAKDEINALLDHLFNHPNTAPFISRLLIQRLTVSNPSPNYIHDVAQAFIDGKFNGKGTGRRGDMLAVTKAILLHPEARETTLASDDAHGKLREPLVRLMHVARAFDIASPQTYGLFPFDQLQLVFSQSPFDSPSVFNFYLPEYQPIGDILDRDIYAPEFEISTDVTSISLANAIYRLVYEGIADEIGRRSYSQGTLDLTYQIALADDIDALIDHLDVMMTAGRLTDENRAAIAAAVEVFGSNSYAARLARVRRAVYLFALLPEFNVIY
ncbi:MAG: DUF1800 family protein [Puniceicoccaceae bacterium]